MARRLSQDEKLDDNMRAYLDYCAAERGITPRSLKAYKCDLVRFSDWMREEQIGQISGKACEQYLETMMDSQKARRGTVIRKARVLHLYLGYLQKNGKADVDESLFQMPVVKTLERKRAEALSKEETDKLFAAMRRYCERMETDFFRTISNRDCAMLMLLYYNRMEISEMIALQLDDYDRKTHTLIIRKANGKSREAYIFSKELRERLEQWLRDREMFVRNTAYANYLFLSKLGRPPSMQQICKVFNQYRDYAGLDKRITAQSLKLSMARYAEELLKERCELECS